MTDSFFLWNRSPDPKECHARSTPFPEKSSPSQKIPRRPEHHHTANRLGGSEGLADANATLSAVKVLLTDNGLGLGDGLLSLGEDKLDVAGVGHVGVDLPHVSLCVPPLSLPAGDVLGFEDTYATVGAVCAAALLGGLVDLDVLDNEVASVKTLGVGVGLGVLEETEEELGGLGGPAGTGDTELLAYISISQPNILIAISILHQSCSRGACNRSGYLIPSQSQISMSKTSDVFTSGNRWLFVP